MNKPAASFSDMHDNTCTATAGSSNVQNRNPIAKSFGSGINRPQVVPNKRADRRIKHRQRWREDNMVMVGNG